MMGERLSLLRIAEDTETTAQDLINNGIPTGIVDDVVLLTKRREATYDAYIDAQKHSAVASMVKKADIVSNLTDNPGNRQTIEMARALIRLCQES
ncbi:MAG: hypothetical protein AAFY69_05370 [Pseudomonadota bacterium]